MALQPQSSEISDHYHVLMLEGLVGLYHRLIQQYRPTPTEEEHGAEACTKAKRQPGFFRLMSNESLLNNDIYDEMIQRADCN